jgi:hypothetical protein
MKPVRSQHYTYCSSEAPVGTETELGKMGEVGFGIEEMVAAEVVAVVAMVE